MAAVNPGDILRCTAEMTNDGEAMQNVYHFVYQNTISVDDVFVAIDLASIMDDQYTIINPYIGNDVAYIQVRMKNVTQNLLMPTRIWPTLVQGQALNPLLPMQAAAEIILPTNVPRVLGRVFLGGWTEDANADSKITTPPHNLIETFGSNLLNPFPKPNGPYQYAIYRRALGTTVFPSTSRVPIDWRTQRRRRRGVGS